MLAYYCDLCANEIPRDSIPFTGDLKLTEANGKSEPIEILGVHICRDCHEQLNMLREKKSQEKG